MPDSLSHYELLERLGTGGMGTVWRARDGRDGRIVAVKVLHAHLAADAEYVRRFEREARIAQRIDSPNVVRVFELGQEGEQYFLVMEYVEGKTLAQNIQEQGRLPGAETVRIATAIAEGLDAAHRVGIVHRDISPQNVILQPDGGVKVTDFGVARDLGATAMTATSMLLGKPQYIAPEVVTGQSAADIRTDIYALGVVTYQMLTGTVPFNAETPYAVMQMQVTGTPPPMSRARADVPVWVRSIVERCLAKRPQDRYQTPAMLVAALGGGGHDGIGGGKAFAGTSPSGRQPWKALLVASGGLGVLLFGSVLAMALANSSDDSPEPATSTPSFADAADDFPTERPAVSTATHTLTTPPTRVPLPTPTNEPTVTSSPTPAPTDTPDPPPTTLSDRKTCEEISGTEYRSDSEREWFLTNCQEPPVNAIAGSNGLLVYARDGQIYSSNFEGANERWLGSGAAPRWSPDGTQIAYTLSVGDLNRVYVMNSDGSNPHEVAIGAGPDWSSSGDRLAFTASSAGSGSIDVFAFNNSLQVNLIAIGSSARWSPNGQTLLFSKSPGIYIANGDGSGEQLLISDGRNQSWSPDGSAFVYICQSSLAICIANQDGSQSRAIVSGLGFIANVSWLAKGYISYCCFGDVSYIATLDGNYSHSIPGNFLDYTP